MLKVAEEYSDLLEIRARIEGRVIDPDKCGNFIICDGRVHI